MSAVEPFKRGTFQKLITLFAKTGAYGFCFVFRYEGKMIEKHESIWGITAGTEDQQA